MPDAAPTFLRVKGMVFAAGLGTRLRPLTDERPKPGVPVANRALASYSIAHLAKYGARSVTLNTHHLGARLPVLLAADTPPGVDLTFVHEPKLLGTGGGLRNAWKRMNVKDDELVLVMNGDVIATPDLAGAIELHQRLGAVATMVLRAHPDAQKFGAIHTDPSGRVRRLLGKPEIDDNAFNEWMFTGVHVLSPRAFADLPEDGCIIRNSYRRWVDSGEVVAGFVDTGAWRDLGSLIEYMDGNLAERAENLIHPTAHVDAQASIHTSIVGAGARVGPKAKLSRVVVWDGAQVNEELVDAVVTGTQIVSIPR